MSLKVTLPLIPIIYTLNVEKSPATLTSKLNEKQIFNQKFSGMMF